MTSVTLTRYLAEQTHREKGPDGSLCQLIEAVASGCTRIATAVSKGALGDALGTLKTENVQGEIQKKLDVLSNDILLEIGESTGCLQAMASEEMESIYPISDDRPKGDYLLLFDPLDGSSNIDVNVSIGTIFSVLLGCDTGTSGRASEDDFLQSGSRQVAAGYVIYGPQNMLVLTTGDGVVGFTLDADSGAWLLTSPTIQIPDETSEFAINMSNMRHWEAPVKRYIDDCLAGVDGPLGKNYNMRWIASMVADVHRILTRGGIFMYPRDQRPSARQGKLRLMYEANPMGFIVEQAGGAAINGTERILDIDPTALHQRTGVILGSKNEVDRVLAYHRA